MNETRFHITGRDGAQIAAFRWQGDAAPRAVLQIAHGMGEHALRYRDKLAPLTERGIVLYANDHRGHGLTSPDSLGDYGPGGAEIVVDDMARLTAHASADFPGLPIVSSAIRWARFWARPFSSIIRRSWRAARCAARRRWIISPR